MKNHPYTSQTFLNTWKEHFSPIKEVLQLPYFQGPLFYDKKFPPLHVNIGSNFTLQNYYQISQSQTEKSIKKAVAVFDVPDYFHLKRPEQGSSIILFIVKEYIGYLIDLTEVHDLDGYMLAKFSSKSRSKFRSYQRKLEKLFPITYKMYFGHIDVEHYDLIMDVFRTISERSFKIKNITNKKLVPKNFRFIKDVVYKLILEKKANLFVVYDRGTPIGISLNYNSDDILFGDSTVYDPDYSKFNIGIVMLMKQIEWCIANNIRIYDFSKAYFDYKAKWCNRSYHFQHHIFCNRRHIKSVLVAWLFTLFLRTKQFLREHPFRAYLIRKEIIGKQRLKQSGYAICTIDQEELDIGTSALDLGKFPYLTKAVNDFAHSHSEHITGIQIFPVVSKANTYCIKGSQNQRYVKILESSV